MFRFLIYTVAAMVVAAGGHKDNPVPAHQMLIVGHRGASRLAPENTVASVVLAYQKKADLAEVDVYLSKDNRIMVIHDKTTQRTTGVDLPVTRTDSERLRTLDAGSFKSPHYANEKIPFLEEVLAVVPNDKKLFIEVKDTPRIVPFLKTVIDNSGKIDQVEIIAFDFEVLLACKKTMPSVPSHYLNATKKDEQTGRYPPYDEALIQKTVDAGLTGLDLGFQGLTKEFVEKAHQAGLTVHVWTVDAIDDAKRMDAYGVDGITTNIPGQMQTWLGP